jgi:hypothetical protein
VHLTFQINDLLVFCSHLAVQISQFSFSLLVFIVVTFDN